jgi:hypothetical protein
LDTAPSFGGKVIECSRNPATSIPYNSRNKKADTNEKNGPCILFDGCAIAMPIVKSKNIIPPIPPKNGVPMFYMKT